MLPGLEPKWEKCIGMAQHSQSIEESEESTRKFLKFQDGRVRLRAIIRWEREGPGSQA